MRIIPLQPIPSQVVRCILNGQACKIAVYQKSTGVFIDLYVADRLIVAGAFALTGNKLVRSEYLGFVGDIGFIDVRPDDPSEVEAGEVYYTGIGSRFLLAYIP